jgi:hypothetical protein
MAKVELTVFYLYGFGDFAVLQSSLHGEWAMHFGSTMRSDPRYLVARCFESFPRMVTQQSESVGRSYHEHRSKLSKAYSEGLTSIYNRFHDSKKSTSDIQKLRELQVDMDRTVAASYGWTDLDLGHGFHKTKQGVRYTISELARREVLQRLLKLNHERYAEEKKKGLHEKNGAAKKFAPKKNAARKTVNEGAVLFDMEEE